MSETSFQNSLREFVPGQIWIKEISLRFFGLQIGTRMTVIRLSDGSLFLHSPVRLDQSLKQEFDKIGRVRFIVSPNNLHHLFLGDYFTEYPLARIYASPGLPEKRKDLKFQYSLHDMPEPEWQEDLHQTIFYGPSRLSEAVFCHCASGTLILADLIMYFDETSAFLTKLMTRFFGIYKQPTPPMDFKINLSQKFQAKLSIEKILQWDFDKIILAHGRLIERDGKKIFQEAFAWLFE